MRTWLLGLALASVGTAAMAANEAPVQAVAGPTAPQPAVPSTAKPGDLTLARVFGNPDLSGPQPRAVRLSPDGALLTSLWLSPATNLRQKKAAP